mmetsp:Transcript_14477/g.58648  ORF Transcript_14477/g.58648 Transcript_14477/m.58648 type:complete len:99 (+) Transcript_14477:4764-5060(+)
MRRSTRGTAISTTVYSKQGAQHSLAWISSRDHAQKQQSRVKCKSLSLEPIDRSRAQVIIIGSIHGDERLGATSGVDGIVRSQGSRDDGITDMRSLVRA